MTERKVGLTLFELLLIAAIIGTIALIVVPMMSSAASIEKRRQDMKEKKVLVVDDEIHIIHVIGLKLRNNGYKVISAADGGGGYELACSERPDIIVTDFQMPVMNGLEFIEKLRANEPTSRIPVIMLTGRNFAIDEQSRKKLRISQCLSKPFSPKELLGMVEDILHREEVILQKIHD